MLTGLKNWIHRQLELFKIKRFLIEENHRLQNLLNLKIRQIIPKIEALDQNKLYFVFIEDNEDSLLFEELYDTITEKMKWTSSPIIVINKPLELLSEDTLQSLLRKVRANKIKG